MKQNDNFVSCHPGQAKRNPGSRIDLTLVTTVAASMLFLTAATSGTEFPTYDIEQHCHAMAGSAFDQCVLEEKAEQKGLQKGWKNYSNHAKDMCLQTNENWDRGCCGNSYSVLDQCLATAPNGGRL